LARRERLRISSTLAATALGRCGRLAAALGLAAAARPGPAELDFGNWDGRPWAQIDKARSTLGWRLCAASTGRVAKASPQLLERVGAGRLAKAASLSHGG